MTTIETTSKGEQEEETNSSSNNNNHHCHTETMGSDSMTSSSRFVERHNNNNDDDHKETSCSLSLLNTTFIDLQDGDNTLRKVQINRTRVQDLDRTCMGTVRYVGPVASASNQNEIYVGIEWDDVSRGKHDGSAICRKTGQRVRHFTCRVNDNGPNAEHNATTPPSIINAGSFVRPKKLHWGIPLTKSLLETRYVTLNDPHYVSDLTTNILPDCYAQTSKGHQKPIEFHGEQQIRQQQQLSLIEVLSLRNSNISSIDVEDLMMVDQNDDDIQSKYYRYHIKELDLAGNMLCDWKDVDRILEVFPHLEKLSLASNQLLDFQNDENNEHIFSSLQVLNVNCCGITSLNTLQQISKMFPNLNELCLAQNDLSNITKNSSRTSVDSNSNKNDNDNNCDNDLQRLSQFSNLIMLDVSNCQLSSWSNQILNVFDQMMPNLKELIVNDNPGLNKIVLSSSAKSNTTYFKSLVSLHLSGCSFEHWSDIHWLSNYIPTMESLRFKSNPLTKNLGTSEARSMILARITNLTYLNSSSISNKERIESERRYVQNTIRYIRANLSIENNNEEKEYTKQRTQIMDQVYKLLCQQEGNEPFCHERFYILLQKHFSQSTNTSSTSISSNGTEEHAKEANDLLYNMLFPPNNSSHHGSSTNNVYSGTTGLGSETVMITITSMLPESCTISPMTKRLPTSITVKRLKQMCIRYFSLSEDTKDFQINYKSDPSDAFPMTLDDEEHTLLYYGIINDGAQLLLNET